MLVKPRNDSTFASANIPRTYVTKTSVAGDLVLLQTWSVQDFTLATQLKPYLRHSAAVTGQVEAMWPDMVLIAM